MYYTNGLKYSSTAEYALDHSNAAGELPGASPRLAGSEPSGLSANSPVATEGFLHLRSRKQDKFHAKSYWSVSPWQERKAQPKSSRLSGWNIGIQADLFGVSLAASSEPAITHWVTSLTPFITVCALKNKESSLLINSIFFLSRQISS